MDIRQLRECTKREFRFSFGCIGIVWKDQQNMAITGEALRSYISEALVSEGISLVEEDEYLFDYEIVNKISVGEGLGVVPRLAMPLYVSTVYVPAVTIEFESDPICGSIDKSSNDEKKMKVRFYYDGFVYCIAVDMSNAPKDYHHGGHMRVLHERFVKLLESSELWSIVESDQFAGHIQVHELKEGHGDNNKRDDWGLACEYSRFSTVFLSYTKNSKLGRSVIDALDSVAGVAISPYAREYYCCILIENQIDHFTAKAKNLINDITNSVLSFYELRWVNIISRYSRSVEISKMTANLYPLIPHIEKLCAEHDYHHSQLKDETVIFGDTFEKPYREGLSSRIKEKKVGFFSRTVEEMISREVSGISSQVNYQFLLLSVLIAVIGVLGSIIVGIIT